MKSRVFAAWLAGASLIAHDWQSAVPGYHFEFPRDHFSHPAFQTEWWYYTGNLKSADGHRYGFELTFFRQGANLSPENAETNDGVWRLDQLYLAHLALSDIDGQQFFHAERLNRAGPGLAGATFNDGRYWNGNWEVRWTALPGLEQSLRAVCDEFSLRLQLSSLKKPVIQGTDGVSRKGPAKGQASHYVSLTRLTASGEVTQKGSVRRVSGAAWMDHEFFTEPASSDLSGWDWFAIQLNNNEELMLYRVRSKSKDADAYSSGSYVDARGNVRFLTAKDFSLDPGESWHSPHSGARYPISWQIRVPALNLNLQEKTDLKDQELWSKNGGSPTYWEGAVRYDGSLQGSPIEGAGYLEMTGYREAIQLTGMIGK